MKLRLVQVSFAVLVLAQACGGGSVGTPQLDAIVAKDIEHAEFVASEVTKEVAETISGIEVTDVSTEEAREVMGDPGEGPQCPGGVGCPCQDPSDCNFPFCIPTLHGSVCSVSCATGDECPQHWSCQQCVGGVDPQFCCVDPWPTLCQPCKKDQDCIPKIAVGNTRYVCIDHGPQGRFCGVECKDDSDCPADVDGVPFFCLQVQVGTSLVKQCQPEAGKACPCTEKFKKDGYVTSCYVENEAGRCEGERTCDSQCSAKVPKPEECNLEDDDCNGKVDDSVPPSLCPLQNTYGTCMGETVCVNGKNICQGAYAAAEICNGKDDDCDGKTDEDFEDLDKDGVADCVDNDDDGDKVADAVDNCVKYWNPDQKDTDKDKVGDACDCDNDGDSVPNNAQGCPVVTQGDNCEFTPNKDQADTDKDGVGDACDCDVDGDGVGNLSLVAPLDGKACPSLAQPDNCLFVPNPDQKDTDKDGVGDACDCDSDGDGVLNSNPGCEPPQKQDNCPLIQNSDQEDLDKDGEGDACDCDVDGDGVGEDRGVPGCEVPLVPDNCPNVFNPGQDDYDADGEGNACDCDSDDDGVPNDNPGCPDCGDTCDNCPVTPNPGQEDMDHNGKGDACEDDWDHDQINNADDNCPTTYNPGQEDKDRDGIGDACDDDIDGDGIENLSDNCPDIPNLSQDDLDQDQIGDACDQDIDGDGDPNETDCAPIDHNVAHGVPEACDTIDNNCNGLVDEQDSIGCQSFFYDQDRDGYGTTQMKCLCGPTGLYDSQFSTDCNDNDKDINPGVREVCGNGKDDNCNGTDNDENAIGCTNFYYDWDQDNWGSSVFLCLCSAMGEYRTKFSGDCDDLDPTVNPNQKEICYDNKDNDCSGSQNDENALSSKMFYLDVDGDGYGTAMYKYYCYENGNYRATVSGDCDDNAVDVNPSAKEVCNNGKDDNCDGKQDDPNSVGCVPYYKDADGDGFGDPSSSMCLCGPLPPYTTPKAGDCQDTNPNVNPGVKEVCNGVDDNCNQVVDDGDHVVLCGQAFHGQYKCEGGKCKVASCDLGWFNVNLQDSDGCECEQDANDNTGNTCESAIEAGTYAEGSVAKTFEGKIVQITDNDWYHFKATDSVKDTGTLSAPGHDKYHVKVEVLYPATGIGIQVRRGACSNASACGEPALTYEWFTDFNGKNPSNQPAGEDPCVTPPKDQGGSGTLWNCAPGTACCQSQGQLCPDSSKGIKYCLDDTADYYVRVFWTGPTFTTDCNATKYAIRISN